MAEIRMILTEDAIHNWDTEYVQRRWRHLPAVVKDAAHAAMVRHHQQGTSAREEAEALNAQFGLRPSTPGAGTGSPRQEER